MDQPNSPHTASHFLFKLQLLVQKCTPTIYTVCGRLQIEQSDFSFHPLWFLVSLFCFCVWKLRVHLFLNFKLAFNAKYLAKRIIYSCSKTLINKNSFSFFATGYVILMYARANLNTESLWLRKYRNGFFFSANRIQLFMYVKAKTCNQWLWNSQV